ncbi:MAG: hypothetical protein CM1200mP41_02330 [Gammaproteobacteria bacterium]|nr:MAG: hypothetical protein CM1200mP41_02330 [Gammaproteobacteria bacterium]
MAHSIWTRGDSVAVALLTVGISTLRHTPRLGLRAAFLFMGPCQECLVVLMVIDV